VVATVPSETASSREAARAANDVLRDIGRVRRLRQAEQNRLNAKVQALQDRFGPHIQTLQEEENALAKQLADIVMPRFELLAASGTKTIKLRSGEVSQRLGPESLEVVGDEATIIKRIQRKGGLGRFTRVGKRTLDKDALKREPRFVAHIKGLVIVRRQFLIIKPRHTQGEITLATEPLSVTLPKGD
jgi:phage host-nuclease inhibitor protein Gam